MEFLLMSAVFFLYNLLYRPLSMDIMLFVYETVFGNVQVWRLSLWICALICLSINLLFFLLFSFSRIASFDGFTAETSGVWAESSKNHSVMQRFINLTDWQSDNPNVRECFLSSLPERKKKKRKDNVWWKCTMSIVCKEKESQCSSYALFYSK